MNANLHGVVSSRSTRRLARRGDAVQGIGVTGTVELQFAVAIHVVVPTKVGIHEFASQKHYRPNAVGLVHLLVYLLSCSAD
jgi:hypothetical protein